jgi:PPOX class probable F420-dependent enzyme
VSVTLPEAAVRFIIEEAPLGHVVTIDEDGSPHVSVAWFDATPDGLVFATLFDQRKLRNLRRDPRISVSFEGQAVNEAGMLHYVVVDGEATVDEGGAPELLEELAHRYIGPDHDFPPMEDPPAGYCTRIAPARVRGIGPWADED